MKQLIVVFILVGLRLYNLPIAQGQQSCGDNGTQTNPDNPFDPRQNSIFLNNNKFDWRTQNYQWYVQGSNSYQTLDAPYYSTNSNVLNYTTIPHPDNEPGDGWELVTYDFGVWYDGSLHQTDHPRFVLYNRYTGILRIFIYFNKPLANADYQTARIRLSYKTDQSSTKQAAILSYSERFVTPLDAFTKKKAFAAVNTVFVTSGEWLVADFPMAYDPCVCQNSYEYLRIRLELILNSSIEEIGKITTSDLKVTNKVPSNNFPNDYKAGLGISDISNGIEGVEAANKSYETADKFKDGLLNVLGKELPSKSKDAKAEVLNSQFVPLVESIPYIGAAIGLIDFFTSGGKEDNKSTLTPVSFEADVNMHGQIQTTVPGTEHVFVVPGSIPPSNAVDQQIPFYNEALGVFNLLETPELEYIDYSWTDWPSYHCSSDQLIVPAVRQFKVKNPIKYAVNPAAHLEIEKFDATFTITYGQDIWKHGIQKGDYFSDQLSMAVVTSGQGSYQPVHRLFPRPFEEFPFLALPGQTYEDRLNRIGMGIETWNVDWPTKGEVVLNTSYIPVGGIQDQTFMLYRDGYWDNTGPVRDYTCYDYLDRFPDPVIRFKVNIIFRRTDNPNAQKINFVATYIVKLTPNPQMAEHWQDFVFTPFDFVTEQTPEGTVVTGLTYKAQPVFTSLLPVNNMGTQYPTYFRLPVDVTLENTTVTTDVTALHNIYIGNNVTFPPNPSGITLKAGNKIIIDPESDFSPIVDMGIGYTRTSCYLDPEALKTTDFSNICGNSTTYDPVVHSKWSGVGTPPAAARPKNYFESEYYTIYPNPAGEQTLVHYSTIGAGEQVRLSVMDVMGKECALLVNGAQEKGEHTYNLNTQQLAPGIYFSRLERNGEVITKKFTVIH